MGYFFKWVNFRWWIISNKAISGNLELNNGKITLDLNGRLTGVSLSLFDEIEKIYG